MADGQHQELNYHCAQIEHRYGENVTILQSPLMLSLLAKLGSPETTQPKINELTAMLYSYLIDQTIDLHFPRKKVTVPTRMLASHPEGRYQGEAIDESVPVVSVDLARAGTFPSHLCYNKMNYLMNPSLVRQDHFYVARATNEHGQVTGVTVSGSKIGGGVKDAIVLFPDPMGATGGTIVRAWKHYTQELGDKPRMLVAMHLIITPEYLARVTHDCPNLKVVALRLDRGLSKPEILTQTPGTDWKNEKGLNEHQYIVPGAGGLGEILNNSYC